MTYSRQTHETVALLRLLSKNLERAFDGRVSTNDITSDRLLWEIFTKTLSILVTCENGLLMKDSLAIHLVARYSYEMLIVFEYIFLDKSKIQEKAERFLRFVQFKNIERMWDNKTYAQMLESIPDKTRLTIHKKHYRNLSNFAHPTMDSFMLNRRGNQSEFSMILNTVLLTTATILEVIKICVEEKLYFNDEQKKMLDIATISSAMDKLRKELRLA